MTGPAPAGTPGARAGLTLGVLPALGSGLTDLRRSGQHERLLDYDLRHYARRFDRIYYFSYFDERLEDFTRDPALLARVRLIPRRGPWPARLYALLLPLLHARLFRACDVLRVMQLTGTPPAILARRLHGVPFVATCGYDYAGLARLGGSRLKPWLLGRLERRAFRSAAGIIVTSAEMERLVRSRPHAPRRVGLFPNGVDLAAFAPREDAGGGASVPLVLHVGRLEPEKNLQRLLEALARLRRPIRCRLVGEGSLRPGLAARARELGLAVEMPGVVAHSALPEEYRGADLFVLPSLSEGHPKVLLEAMASGLACAVSDVPGTRAIADPEETALFFPATDVEAMARALGRLLEDPLLRARLGRAAREAVGRRFEAGRILTEEARWIASLGRGGEALARAEGYAIEQPMDPVVPAFLEQRLPGLCPPGARAVLDVGAGDGRYLGRLRDLCPGALVVGVELSPVRARRIAALGLPVVVAAAEALPFRPGAFDLATCFEVIEHTESPGATLDELARVLAPGGRLLLTTPGYPAKRLFDLRAALRARSLARLRDDPTHISPLSAGRLERLLAARFAGVALEGTAVLGEGKVVALGRLRSTALGRRLANKLFAVCAKAGAPAAAARRGEGVPR